MRYHNKKEQALSCLKNAAFQYRHAWILSYLVIYLAWFAYLEQTVTKKFHIITLSIDLRIPFCEYFIIPYLLWFAYVAVGITYFFFKDREDFYKLCAFLFTGMTVFLIVSTIYPNGHYLRPDTFVNENWCTRLVERLYQIDTATNLFPSIHVYNSIGVHIAVTRSARLQNKKACKAASLVLCWSIVLSTVFLKQHSVFDVITAFGMAAVMYYVVYRQAYRKVLAAVRMDKRKEKQVLRGLRL